MIHRTRHSLRLAAVVVLGAALGAQIVPPGIQRPPSEQAASPTLSGLWTGEARENVPGVGTTRYPVEMRFSGSPEALTLEVRATARVQADDERLTIEIRASYRGKLVGDRLRMRSEKITTRVVEYDEVLPSAPQTLEANLADGILRGRVGSADEGWTSFEARAERGGAPSASAKREPEVAGSWRGTGREPGPNGGELRFPVQLEVRAGPDGALTAEMRADVDYPDGQGGTVAVQVSATLRGQLQQSGEITLESESSVVRVPSRNTTQQGPPQRGRGRVDNGILRLEMGDDPASRTRLELRRASDPQPAAPTPSSDADRSQPDRPAYGGDAEASSAPSGGGTMLVLEQREIRDPAMNDIVSHRLYVPQGWQFEGGPRWNATPANLVDFLGGMRGPDGQEIAWCPSFQMSWRAISGQPTQGADGPGIPQADGSLQRRPPSAYGEVATQILLPRLRPNATDVRLVRSERLPEVEQRFRDVYAEPLRMLEQLHAQMRQGAVGVQSDAQLFVVAERAVVRYRENGTEWEEELRSTQFGSIYTNRADFMATEHASWSIFEVKACRAAAGRLEAELPTLLSLAGTVQEQPRWSLAVAKLRAELQAAAARGRRIAMEQARREAAASAASGDSVSDIMMRGWKNRQASIDRMHKATIDSVHESQDFRAADGTTFAVSNQFGRAFRDGQGRMILTDVPDFQPSVDPRFRDSNWQELQRIDPFRDR